ncbi:MAG TPA: phosphopantetheine-binding protein [Blastocatellia bacterium]|nr:phosphopantetheine-binding protein [Blastocatellia bacterium]
MDEIKNELRTFLRGHLRHQEIQDDDDIFALGYISSLFAMQLVTFIESRFDIHVDGDDLDFENFRSINAIDGLVKRKRISAPV